MVFVKTQRFALLSSFFVLLTQPTVVLAGTLEEAVAAALQHHPRIEAAQAGLEVADEERKSEFSGYFPEVGVTGTGGRVFGDNSTSRGLSVTRGTGYSYLWEGSVTARQMIFDGFETPSRVASARAKEASASMGLLDVGENLAYAAVQTYIDLIRTSQGLGLLREHSAKIDDYLQRIKISVDEGVSDEAEYQQALDVRVILDGFIADYNGQYQAARARYIEITGEVPEGDMVKPASPLDMLPENIDAAIDLSKEEHPSVRTALYSSKSVEHEIGAEQASLYPDVDGELSYLKSDKEDVIGGEAIDARAVMRLNWNLEVGGGQLARIRKKKQEHYQSLARVREIQRQIEQNIRLAFSEYETALRQLENQNKRINLNEKLFDTYGVQFEGARITLLQLMQADNQYFTKKLDKINGQYRVLAAQYGVLASMGRLQDALNVKISAVETAQYEQQ